MNITQFIRTSIRCFSIRVATVLFLSFYLVNGLLARESIDFNSGWKFVKGPFSQEINFTEFDFNQFQWEAITVPHTWNAVDMQTTYNKFYQGDALYYKKFNLNDSFENKRIFIKFEGVGSIAEVYVNKIFAGKHAGGYSAFNIEITDCLNSRNDNEIIVKVNNQAREDVIPINHRLFGVYGGIYRPVHFITTDETNITLLDNGSSGVFVSQKNVTPESALIEIKVKLETRKKETQQVLVENSIYDSNGVLVKQIFTSELLQPQGLQVVTHNLTLENPMLWQGLENPYLYKVVTSLKSGNRIIDEVINPLGVKNIEIKAADGVYLNGKKIPMYGVCRHQDWWTLGSALENKHHDVDLEFIKEIGATTIRLAHYQQSEYFYSRCDSIGFLVWAEIPFVNKVSTVESGNAKQQLTELIRQNYNHPSIYVWGLHNEVYEPYNFTKQLTRELHDLAKTEDLYRPTVSVNGYGDINNLSNSHADIQGINRYFGWYERKIDDLEVWIKNLKNNYPQHKVILAEYGTEGNINQQVERVGNIGDCCGPTKNYNETFQTKFHEMQWSYIKNNPYLIASYIWNTFDFATPESYQGGVQSRNMKGLITFDRKIKKDAFFWYKANWSKEPICYITQRRVSERAYQITPVAIYSNVGIPTLYVNNKKTAKYKKGATDVHYIFEDVKLKKGRNIIKASVVVNGKKIEDAIEWNYIPSKEPIILQPQERKGVLTGL